MSDFEGIDGIRFKAMEMARNPELSQEAKDFASLLSSMSQVLIEQGVDHLQALEKQVMYLDALYKQRNSLWGTLAQLAEEISALREQLVEALAHLEPFLPPKEE